MRSAIVVLAELAPDMVLAPERHLARGSGSFGEGVPLADLVVERSSRAAAPPASDARARSASTPPLVLDTTHARDGILDVVGALRDTAHGRPARSAKKRVEVGDLLVSRLRPYLRQIALVPPSAIALAGGRSIAVSTEFYVLSPREAGDDIAFLLPYFLAAETQASLAGAQEGGHHPRVPRTTLFSLRVPRARVARRAETSRAVRAALDGHYRASSRLRGLVDGS